MFMVIGVKNDRVAVLDTSDNVVEVYKKSEVVSIARSGIEIKGVDASSGVVEMQKGIFKGCTRLKELFIDDIKIAKSLDLSMECPSIIKYRTLTGVYNKYYERI